MPSWLESLFPPRNSPTAPAWWHWLENFFRPRPTPAAPRPVSAASAPRAVPADRDDAAPDPHAFPSAPRVVDNTDAPQILRSGPLPAEVDLMRRVKDRIEAGKYELPQLPSTSLAVLDMASNPSADVGEMADLIEVDPVLSTELLREANSALLGARVPAETLHDAISRLGLRRLRSLILALSMRGLIFSTKSLRHHASEAWRQAYSVGSIARVVANHLGMDRERAFLAGLLHDVGKIPILHMLSEELGKKDQATMSLVGRLYLRYHERVGGEMAAEWKLPEEVISVAGHHHAFLENEEFPVEAALCSLSHKMDLFLSLGAEREYLALAKSEEMDALSLPTHKRRDVLEEVLTAYRQVTERLAA